MTSKLDSLRALQTAVKAGADLGYGPTANQCDAAIPGQAHLIFAAFDGSLDAARQLHEALLPGWVGSSDTEGFAKVGKGSRGVQTVMYAERIDGQPARAWLLAILRALKARA